MKLTEVTWSVMLKDLSLAQEKELVRLIEKCHFSKNFAYNIVKGYHP